MNPFSQFQQKPEKLSLIKPPQLKAGDLIGIVSPAGPVNEADLEKGLRMLESSGYKVRMGAHIFDRDGYLAGSDVNRLEDLHSMIQDPHVKAVFCGRGGYGILRIIDKIDYGLIRNNPKIIVGFSDISALLLAAFHKSGLVSFHGPMVRSLGRGDPNNWTHLVSCLTSVTAYENNLDGCSVLTPGTGSGRLVGGNLSLLSHLVGTPYMPSLEGAILFLEDIGEAPYRIDRMLTHLKLTGLLDGLNAIIAGEFTNCEDVTQIDRLFSEMGSHLGIPVVSGFPIGHGPQNLTLPIGISARLDTERMTLTIKEACVQ